MSHSKYSVSSYIVVEVVVVNSTFERPELSMPCLTIINNLCQVSIVLQHSAMSHMLLHCPRGCRNTFDVRLAMLFENEKSQGRTFISAKRPYQQHPRLNKQR